MVHSASVLCAVQHSVPRALTLVINEPSRSTIPCCCHHVIRSCTVGAVGAEPHHRARAAAEGRVADVPRLQPQRAGLVAPGPHLQGVHRCCGLDPVSPGPHTDGSLNSVLSVCCSHRNRAPKRNDQQDFFNRGVWTFLYRPSRGDSHCASGSCTAVCRRGDIFSRPGGQQVLGRGPAAAGADSGCETHSGQHQGAGAGLPSPAVNTGAAQQYRCQSATPTCQSLPVLVAMPAEGVWL